MLKKEYISPEFDLKIVYFESLMAATMQDSRAEDGASGGNEGGGGDFGEGE